MTSDGDALFRAICEQPWEDTPRLVYADWLDENGDPARAEFIRLQIELAMPGANTSVPSLGARARALHRESHGRWTRGSPTGNGVRVHRELRRGFYNEVHFNGENVFAARAAEVFAWAPIDTVAIRWVSLRSFDDVLAVTYLTRVTSLTLWQECDDKGARAIARCLKLLNVVKLNVFGTRLTDQGAIALARSPYLRRLTNLRLVGADRLSPSAVLDMKKRFEQFTVR